MNKVKLILTLIVIFAVIFIVASKALSEKNIVAREAKRVVTQKVTMGDIEKIGQYSAIVKGEKESQLSPKISGIITGLLKKEGDFVKKGELLAIIDGSELYAEKDLVSENISSSKDLLKQTSSYYDQLINETKTVLEKSEKIYALAKLSGSSNEAAIAKKDLENAKEAVSSAKKLRDLKISSAESQLNISEKNLGITNAHINNTRIFAPFSGIISSRSSQLGSLVSPGNIIYSLSSSDKKEIEISAPGGEAEKMVVGQPVRLINNENKEFKGAITSISPVSDFDNRKSSVIISISPEIRLGTYVNVFISLEKKEGVILVPTESIIKKYHDNFIYVIENNNSLQRKVITGITQNDLTEILSGVNENDILAVKGQHYLRDGDTVDFQN